MSQGVRPGEGDPIVTEIEQFAREHDLEKRAAELDRTAEFPRAEFQAMGRAGLLGLHIDAARGGRALPLRRTAIGLYHLAFHGGTAFAKLALQPEFSSVLAEHGSPELVDRYFRRLVRGELLIGNHVTEPGAGSDAGAIELTASRIANGYRLTGTKSEAAFAQDADAAIVYARVEGATDRGITAFLVPQRLPGIARETTPDLGERWMRRGRVAYDQVEVPEDHRIGEEGRAFDYLKAELTRERALLAAIYLGVARASWEEVVRHVGVRQAFGRPLAAQEAVAFPLVEDWTRLDAAWLYTEAALTRLESGEDVTAQAALAKWLAVEASLSTIDHAIQFHGGAGYSAALPHERRWRDVRSGRIAHGPSEIMHVVAARSLWPGARRPN